MAIYGKEPSDEDLAIFLGWHIKTIRSAKLNSYKYNATSLDKVITTADDEVTLGELQPSNENMEDNILEDIFTNQLKTALWEEVETLGVDKSQLLKKIYKENQTRVDIASELGISKQAITDREQRALGELRKSKHIKVLEPYFDYYNNGLKNTSISYFRHTFTSSTEYTALKHLGKRAAVL